MTQDSHSPTPLRSRRSRWLYICLAIMLLAGAAILWSYRDQLRSPRALYEEASASTPLRAVRLYTLLAKRVPELEEYWELWSAQACLPAFEAVEALHSVALYRPDSPSAYHAHLALARYYASIESFETDNEYLAALHILAPLCERLFKAMVVRAGVPTLLGQQQGTQQEATLGKLLDNTESPHVCQLLSPDLLHFLRYAWVDEPGLNLRNRVAHGWVRPAECNWYTTLLLLWTVIHTLGIEPSQ